MVHAELSLNAVLKCRYAFARPNSRHSPESAVSAEAAVFIEIDYCNWVVRFCACVDSEISCPRYDVPGDQVAVGSEIAGDLQSAFCKSQVRPSSTGAEP